MRALALQALAAESLEQKLALVGALYARNDSLSIAISAPIAEPPGLPGLVDPAQLPWRPAHTLDGRAALVHAICHIEFNAIKIPFNDSQSTIIKFYRDSV